MLQDNIGDTAEAPYSQNLFTMKNSSNLKRQDSTEEIEEHYLKRTSSFKQVCQFPVSFCRRNSRDFLTWVNGFTITRSSPSSTVENYYKQIQASLVHFLLSIAVFILMMEIGLCLTLLINIFLETGFVFLLATFIGVCSIYATIMTNIHQFRNKKRKEKSKEI